MSLRGEVLDILGSDEKFLVEMGEICRDIAKIPDARLAYYLLYYYGKRPGCRLSCMVVERLYTPHYEIGLKMVH